MEMRKTLLEKCEEVIDNTSWPFKSNNLKTGKIFNDLLQYHTMESGELRGLTIDVSSKQKLPHAMGRKGSHQFNGRISTRSGATQLTGMTSNLKPKKGVMHAT